MLGKVTQVLTSLLTLHHPTSGLPMLASWEGTLRELKSPASGHLP